MPDSEVLNDFRVQPAIANSFHILCLFYACFIHSDAVMSQHKHGPPRWESDHVHARQLRRVPLPHLLFIAFHPTKCQQSNPRFFTACTQGFTRYTKPRCDTRTRWQRAMPKPVPDRHLPPPGPRTPTTVNGPTTSRAPSDRSVPSSGSRPSSARSPGNGWQSFFRSSRDAPC